MTDAEIVPFTPGKPRNRPSCGHPCAYICDVCRDAVAICPECNTRWPWAGITWHHKRCVAKRGAP